MRASYKNVKARILRVYNKKEMEGVWEYLSSGENIIALYPREQLTLHERKDKEDFEEIESMFAILEPSIKESFSKSSLGGKNSIWWKLIDTDTKGKLLVTQDSFLSDGYFLEGYGKNEINQKQLNEITEEFRTFKYNLVDVILQEESLTWICDEPIEYILTLINHGPFIDDFIFSVEIDEAFEPLSILEIRINNFPNLGKRSLAVKCIPRVIGKFENIIQVHSSVAEINFNTKSYVEIKPNNYQKEKSTYLTDDEGLSLLMREYARFGDVSRIIKVRDLMRIDIDSALNKLRSIAEDLATFLIESAKLKKANNLNSNIEELKKHNRLSQKAIGYFHTVRIIGNLGSHSTGEELDEIDVRISSYALGTILKEINTGHNI